MLGYADLRPERQAEITSQIGDLPSFFAALDFLDPGLTPWTLLIMQATLRFAATVTHRVKFGLNCPRPLLFSPLIQPMLLTPTHGAFPSAHATEAHALATVLTRLTGGDPVADLVNGGQRFMLAERIAVNARRRGPLPGRQRLRLAPGPRARAAPGGLRRRRHAGGRVELPRRDLREWRRT